MSNEKSKLEIKRSNSFVSEACKRAIELLSEGKTEGLYWKNLSVFVDREPKHLFMVIPPDELPEKLKGRFVFIGVDQE